MTVSARDYIRLRINHQPVEVRGAGAMMTLAEFLRQQRGLIGTKVVCAEGDCGACTVLCRMHQPADDEHSQPVRFVPIDSCIRFVFQLDGAEIITIEDMAKDQTLNPVQQAMVDCHGSQCGFCTPGFVMSMAGLAQQCEGRADGERGLTDAEMRDGLSGNLCRCTGYTPILQAGRSLQPLPSGWPARCRSESTGKRNSEPRFDGDHQRVQQAGHQEEFCDRGTDAIELVATDGVASRRVLLPADLGQALAFREAHPDAKVVAGATDVGVQYNKRQIAPEKWLDLSRLASLRHVELQDECLQIGALTTWSHLMSAIRDRLPELHRILRVFGAPQIRHVGTVGGNIVNASPISDFVPFLMMSEARLTLASRDAERQVTLQDFLQGYRQVDLRDNELLTGVIVPLPAADSHWRLYKVSRRHDLDIAGFSAAILMRLNGGTITEARIAYGAVGPVVLRMSRTESFLRDKRFCLETMTEAGEIANQEIEPISDVRGSSSYRRQLACNVLKKFFHQVDRGETRLPLTAGEP